MSGARSVIVVRDARTQDELLAEVRRLANEHTDAWAMGELREEELTYAYCRRPSEQCIVHRVFYKDFDDYEDDIVVGSRRWLRTMLPDATEAEPAEFGG